MPSMDKLQGPIFDLLFCGRGLMAIMGETLHLAKILQKAEEEAGLSREEVLFLLNLKEPKEVEQVFSVAQTLRSRYFDQRVFLYGFVYFSTYCRNNCAFCYYRRTNKIPHRYRKEISEIIETAGDLAQSGVHLIDLTMGEDPQFLLKEKGQEKLIEMVAEVKKHTQLPVMISPGVVSESLLLELKKAGANWYACYQETHNRKLYGQLRLEQSYDERMERKLFARKIGMLVEEGLMTGIGDNLQDVADSLKIMGEIGAEQVRVMSFVPQKGTPMYNSENVPRLRELLIIAVMRILYPQRLIPASLDVDGIMGLKQRLEAGANVVTSIIPPQKGLLGVSRCSLDIEEGHRTVQGVLPVLEELGLEAATAEEYSNWVADKQNQL